MCGGAEAAGAESKGGVLGVLVVMDAGWWMEAVTQHWAGTAGQNRPVSEC